MANFANAASGGDLRDRQPRLDVGLEAHAPRHLAASGDGHLRFCTSDFDRSSTQSCQNLSSLSTHINWQREFLNNISTLLDVDAPFQVDSLEYAPERFSLSGTIDSYDRLQLLKNNLQEFEEFKGRNIIESNRKVRRAYFIELPSISKAKYFGS